MNVNCTSVFLSLPLCKDYRLHHIAGGNVGGGFEWYGSPQTKVKDGVSVKALELNNDGKMTRFTSVYAERQLGKEKKVWMLYAYAVDEDEMIAFTMRRRSIAAVKNFYVKLKF